MPSRSHLPMPHSLWPLGLELCCCLHFHGPSHQAISTSSPHQTFIPLPPKLSPPVHFCIGTSILLVPFGNLGGLRISLSCSPTFAQPSCNSELALLPQNSSWVPSFVLPSVASYIPPTPEIPTSALLPPGSPPSFPKVGPTVFPVLLPKTPGFTFANTSSCLAWTCLPLSWLALRGPGMWHIYVCVFGV